MTLGSIDKDGANNDYIKSLYNYFKSPSLSFIIMGKIEQLNLGTIPTTFYYLTCKV